MSDDPQGGDGKAPRVPPNAIMFTDAWSKKVPPGDDKERLVCNDCGFVNYVNPKIVVGVVATDDRGHILLCRRAIEPRYGFWTLPAGFMEEGESVEDGACREAFEEAGAEIDLGQLLAVYSIPRISQVQIMHVGKVTNVDGLIAKEETLELALFAPEDIPWDQLAFPSVYWALTQYAEVKDKLASGQAFAPFANPPGENGNALPRSSDRSVGKPRG